MWPFSSSGSSNIVVAEKRAERSRLVQAAASLTDEHEQFLRADAVEIASRIESGEWTARQVTQAYIAQAAAAHLATNCATEILFEQALERADELDRGYASTKKLRGPFHGVPFSLKDQYDIAGFDTSIGFTTWTNKPATSNAVLVDQMISLGAIPLVKTNVPQTMFSFECNNPLWGRTTNPYNPNFTCGGSSGGEAALLAMDGAGIGLGSDIGGSLRLPAAYCGIYSLKPSYGRLSRGGIQSSNPGYEGIKVVCGPMTRSVRDIKAFCKAIFGLSDPAHRDYSFTPMPYREPEMPSKLRFGYYTSDGFAKASPANKRAILETVEALTKQGHECVEIELPDAARATEIFLALSSSEGYRRLTKPIGPDPMDASLWLPVYGSRVPQFIRTFGAWVAERIIGDSLFARFIRVSRIKPVGEYIQWTDRRNKWNSMFYEKVWNRYKLDGILCPVQAMPQIANGASTSVNALVTSTALYNLVDSPVGIIPVTQVDQEKDELTAEWTASDSQGSILMEKRLYKAKNPLYNPSDMEGMPVAIQVVGQRWEDEKVIAMMGVVEEALGSKRGFGPRGVATALKAM